MDHHEQLCNHWWECKRIQPSWKITHARECMPDKHVQPGDTDMCNQEIWTTALTAAQFVRKKTVNNPNTVEKG